MIVHVILSERPHTSIILIMLLDYIVLLCQRRRKAYIMVIVDIITVFKLRRMKFKNNFKINLQITMGCKLKPTLQISVSHQRLRKMHVFVYLLLLQAIVKIEGETGCYSLGSIQCKRKNILNSKSRSQCAALQTISRGFRASESLLQTSVKSSLDNI